MISPRPNEISQINYVLVTEKDTNFIPFIPPKEFLNGAIDLVRRLPKDILQINDAVSFLELSYRTKNNNPYRFSIVYSSNLNLYFQQTPKDIIRLYLIDTTIKDLNMVVDLLQQNEQPLSYHYFFGNEEQQNFNLPNQINTPGEFLQHLYFQHEEILKLIGAPIMSFHPHVDVYARDFYEYPKFIPAQNNFHVLNTIIGNFPYENVSAAKTKEELIEEHKEETDKAHAGMHSFDRLDKVLDSTRKIDIFFELMRKENIAKPVNLVDPQYAPLIIVAPYQNPDIVQLSERKTSSDIEATMAEVVKNLNFEQSSNYINSGIEVTPENFLMIATLTQKKNTFLDHIAALHSSFTYSPIIRLPYQGKSLNNTLSAFDANEVNQYADHNTRIILKETISKFGIKLAQKILSDKLENKLIKENRQLVTITDMPIEWLEIQGVPLTFTHDICRLPETALHGLMSSFVTNEKLQYRVPKDILSRTLVIFGSNDLEFSLNREPVLKLAKTHGFETKVCLSVSQVVKACDEFRPDFLIFDCHGGYDAQTKTSYLLIGEEQLTGPMIVSNNIHAPLVFLSACNTAPTYGTINTIANAFFENQSMSVTATYLPIAIESASILYLRILNNLKLAATQPIHENWLNFLSYNIRTSFISEIFRLAANSKKKEDETAKEQAIAYNKSMAFQLRRNVFSDLINKYRSIVHLVVPEYLFYSNLGRSDLITFEVHSDKFKELNKLV